MTTTRDNIPVTNVARTLADLATVASPKQVRAATRQAEFRGYPLGEAVSDGMDSHLERRFLASVPPGRAARAGAERPDRPYRVDFLWRDHGLVVEVDDWKSHRGRQAFEDDRARDAFLAEQESARGPLRRSPGSATIRASVAASLHKIITCPRNQPPTAPRSSS